MVYSTAGAIQKSTKPATAATVPCTTAMGTEPTAVTVASTVTTTAMGTN